LNNFFTPIFRLAKHHPLPWVPLRAINMPNEPRQAVFVATPKRPAGAGLLGLRRVRV
jgi:hypothetical protein